jgi:ribosomal 30S subunit maturation factor RimM
MDHSSHPRLTDSEYTEANLTGATVYGPEDQNIGTVSHTHGMGASAHVVIDVGGFLGIGAKPVQVPASQLDFMRDESGTVHAVTNWTKDDLKAMPRHED